MSSGLQGGGCGSQIKLKAETTSGVNDAPGEIHIVGHAVKSKPHVALEPRNSRMRVLPLLNFHVHLTVPLPTESRKITLETRTLTHTFQQLVLLPWEGQTHTSSCQ